MQQTPAERERQIHVPIVISEFVSIGLHNYKNGVGYMQHRKYSTSNVSIVESIRLAAGSFVGPERLAAIFFMSSAFLSQSESIGLT